MLKKEKYKLDNLTYSEVCLIGQSIGYRIKFYEDRLVQQPNDELYKKCLKELKGLRKRTDPLEGKTKMSSSEKNLVGMMMKVQLARTK